MDEVKDLVEHALEQKRVLSRLKAELRAHVFLAIDEQEKSSGQQGLAHKTDNPHRSSLLEDSDGPVLVGLIREFLQWAGMDFTLKVFEPEMGQAPDEPQGRDALSKQLGLHAPEANTPLLMLILRQFNAGFSGTGATVVTEHPASAVRLLASPTSLASASKIPSPPLSLGLPPTTTPTLPPTLASPIRPSLLPQAPGLRGALLPPVSLHPEPSQPELASPLSHSDAQSNSEMDSPMVAPTRPVIPPFRAPLPTHDSSMDAPLPAPRGVPPLRQLPVPTAVLPPAPPPPLAHPVEDSYADDIDQEDIDDDLEGAEIDEEEDYAAVFKPTTSSGSPPAGQPEGNVDRSHPGMDTGGVRVSEAEARKTRGSSDGGAPARLAIQDAGWRLSGDGGDTLADSGLSVGSGWSAGRIRPQRSGARAVPAIDDERRPRLSSGDGDGELSADLMAGDRSFGMSHELTGLAPPPYPPRDLTGVHVADEFASGSVSGDLLGPRGVMAGSLSMSGDLSKPHKLDPLPSPGSGSGALGPLNSAMARLPVSSLAPLGKPALGSVGMRSPLPAAHPMGMPPLAPAAMGSGAPPGAGGGRKDGDDIKLELRRAGLLNAKSRSLSGSGGGSADGGSSRVSSNGGDEGEAGSRRSTGGVHGVADSRRSSGAGEGIATARQSSGGDGSGAGNKRSSANEGEVPTRRSSGGDEGETSSRRSTGANKSAPAARRSSGGGGGVSHRQISGGGEGVATTRRTSSYGGEGRRSSGVDKGEIVSRRSSVRGGEEGTGDSGRSSRGVDGKSAGGGGGSSRGSGSAGILSGSISDGSLELDLPDNARSQDGDHHVSEGDSNSGSSIGLGTSNNSKKARPVQVQGPGVRAVRGGVYDAEFSLNSQSMDITAEDNLRSSRDSDGMGLQGRGGQAGLGHYNASKSLSMDLRDTGLSASDKSGDLDKIAADFAETAEWGE